MTALAVGPVALRPLKLTDAPKLRAIVDEESWQGNSTPFPTSDDQMRDHLRSLIEADNFEMYAVERTVRWPDRSV